MVNLWGAFVHRWERQLASVTTDRVVRPFDWGLDWIPQNGHVPGTSPDVILGDWISHVMTDTDGFFTPGPTDRYALSAASASGDRTLMFPSAFTTPHRENNTVYARYMPGRRASRTRRPRAAVVVLPQWNAGPGGHIGLCR